MATLAKMGKQLIKKIFKSPDFVCLWLALLSGWLAYEYLFSMDEDKILGVVGVFATVSVTLMGFSMTALAILTALTNRRLLVNMAKTGHARRLYQGLFGATTWFLFSLIVSLVGLFWRGDPLIWVTILLISIFSFALAKFVYAGVRFYIVLMALE